MKAMMYETSLGRRFARAAGPKEGQVVVLESGYGNDSTVWSGVAGLLAKEARVIAYDRAGLGRSEAVESRRTSSEMVEELAELLDVMGVKAPYVLVGHSFGGINVRLFAARYPEKVAGIVLVDATPEMYQKEFLPHMPPAFQSAYFEQFTREGNADEFKESLAQMRNNPHPPDIPLLVLCAGRKDRYSPETQARWNRLQHELSLTSMKGEYQLFPESAHFIQHEAPDEFVRAVGNFMKHLRGGNHDEQR